MAPTLEQRKADALVHVARGYLAHAPTDRSGEDRHLVIIQVSADALTRNVPAGTPPHPTTSPPLCHVVGHDTPLEPATAERLACTGKIALQITSDTGEILHLGRSRRLASPAQRRALRLRDRTCSFPGCHQSRHLDAHHVTPWSEGGTTDIDGLALLCRRHHVIVHEGGHHLVPMKDQPAAP
ncbi:HNH endonuclease, partial [Brachybacterium muris]|uniref:HNH endonuclease signature motif containing protein n=1 Tax=Brachybacterium muris TaxID=219301 RepID=UPI00223B9849|nr:HNH endonuclease [Brachybacterium muris]